MSRLQDVRAFIGAVFDEVGSGLIRAGLATDTVEQYMEDIMGRTGARTFGYWEDGAGMRLSECSWLRVKTFGKAPKDDKTKDKRH